MENIVNQLVFPILAQIIVAAILSFFSFLYNNIKGTHSQKHYRIKKRSSSFLCAIYIPLIILLSIILFIALYFITILIIYCFYNKYFYTIIYFINNAVFLYICIFIISILLNTFVYNHNFFKNFNFKSIIIKSYIFSPSLLLFLLLISNIAHCHVIIIAVIYALCLILSIPFQPRIDSYTFQKMDIELNNGKCYNALSTHNISFDKDHCIIQIYYSHNPSVVMSSILIPISNIASKRYYDIKCNVDYYYTFLLKHFPFIFDNSK